MTDHENTNERRPGAAGMNGKERSGDPCCRPEAHHGHRGDCGGGGWWEERSLSQKILMGIGFGILGIGLFFLCGWVVMLLWNWLMPDIFGLKRLTYWQGWGLLVLSHLLFKGFGSGHNNGRSDRKRRRHLRRYLHEEQAAMKEAHESE
jgi:hypothetical protein